MKHLPFALAPLALLSSLPAHASLASDDEATLPAIVVTVSRSEDQTTAQHLVTIDREQIERSAASDLPGLLRQVPGLQVRQLFGNINSEASVDLGGFGATASTNTLILIDGRRLNDVDLAAADIGGLALDSIERIEIMPAAGGVLYGDGAVGGAINIVTRNKRDNSSELKLGVGSYQTREARLSHNFSKGNTSGRLFAGQTDSDGYRSNNEVRRLDAGGKLAQRLGSSDEVYLNLLGSRQDSGLPGARRVTPASNQLKNDPRGTSTPLDFADESRLQAVAGWRRELDAATSLIVEVGHRHKAQQAYYDFSGFPSYVDTTLATTSFTPRLETRQDWGTLKGRLQTGIDLYDTRYDSDRKQSKNSAAIHQLGIHSLSASLYAQQTVSAGRNTLTLGARELRNRFRAADQYDASAPGGAFDNQATPLRQTQKAGMYEINLSRQFSDDWQAGIGFARSARLATVDELYEYDSSFLHVFSPLKVQTGKNVSVYSTLKTRLGEFSGNAWYNRLENEIHFNPASFTNENLDPTRRQGITLAWLAHVGSKTDVQLQGTVQDAEFRAGPNRGNSVPLTARHSGGVTLNHQLTPVWMLSAASNYVGSRYFDNDESNDFGQKLSRYVRTDLSAKYHVKSWSVTAAVNNVTNERDQVDYGVRSPFTPGVYNAYPLPGRNVMLSAQYSF